ncbi:MAG: hypothetical protein OXR64_03715 [Chloroflexota bacterium]|nr:hypothetical protein [Chloroflexota bacterium]MDE2918932.1 hypothetical protein [Chloroflexota bacterium]
MQLFRDPQRDSRENIRAAQQALVYAGYPHGDAVTEVTTHLHRVRAALAAPRHAMLAGFLSGAGMAIGAFLVLTLALGGLGLVMGVVGDSGTPAEFTPAAPPAPQADTSPGSPLGVLPAVAVAAPVLGLAGVGMSRVTRNRWRRAGVLQTFVDLRPRRRYLLETAVVWLAVAGLIVLIVWALAGPQLGATVAQMLAFFGIPVGASAFAAWFPKMYAWILPRVSPVDAAAAARPIIEREAARQIKTERDFYGASGYDRTAYDRNRWADEILEAEPQGYFAQAQRREDTARGIAQRSGAYSYGMSGPRRLARYALIAGVATLAMWFFISRLLWIMLVDEPGLEAGILALILGAAIGLGLTWLYARYFEGL